MRFNEAMKDLRDKDREEPVLSKKEREAEEERKRIARDVNSTNKLRRILVR